MKRIRQSAQSLKISTAALGLTLGACWLLAGCTDKDAPTDNTAMLPDNERVSSVPWNKPEGWENQGALGALQNDPRIGTNNR